MKSARDGFISIVALVALGFILLLLGAGVWYYKSIQHPVAKIQHISNQPDCGILPCVPPPGYLDGSDCSYLNTTSSINLNDTKLASNVLVLNLGQLPINFSANGYNVKYSPPSTSGTVANGYSWMYPPRTLYAVTIVNGVYKYDSRSSCTFDYFQDSHGVHWFHSKVYDGYKDSIVIDGKTIGPLDGTILSYWISTSSDDTLISFLISKFVDAKNKKSEIYVYDLSQRELTYKEDLIGADITKLIVSFDKKEIAYPVDSDGKHFLVIGTQKVGPFDFRISDIKYSPDGQKIAVLESDTQHPQYFLDIIDKNKNHKVVRVNNSDRYSPFTFDNKNELIYGIENTSSRSLSLVVGDHEIKVPVPIRYYLYRSIGVDEPYSYYNFYNLGGIIVSDNNKRAAILLQGDYDSRREIIDLESGQLTSEIEIGGNDADSQFSFDPLDSGKYIYVRKDYGKVPFVGYVFLNSERFGPYDQVDQLKFTPDGKYIVYGTQEGDELWWRVKLVK